MSNLIGNLTKGELVQVCGRLVERVGKKLDEGDIADKIELSEALAILQETAVDLMAEYSDEN